MGAEIRQCVRYRRECTPEFRYLLASLDYRFVHVTARAPADFGTFSVAPIEIVRHLCDLLALIQRQFGQEQAQTAEGTFEAECERFRGLAGSPVERVRYWQVEMPAPASRSHGSEGANTL
jgi:hypothetical protein